MTDCLVLCVKKERKRASHEHNVRKKKNKKIKKNKKNKNKRCVFCFVFDKKVSPGTLQKKYIV